MPTTSIDPVIFRPRDIRGIAGTQVTEDAFFLIGKAFGSEIRERTGKPHPVISIGRDARLHSPGLSQAFIEGLLTTGAHIKQIGQTPTPLHYFTLCTQEFDAGAQITASHNPPADNGVKLRLQGSNDFSGGDIQGLRMRIDEERFLEGEGHLEVFDAETPYRHFLVDRFSGRIGTMKVVVDGGNGVAGPLYCETLRQCGLEVVELFTEPDGRFPNHHANPGNPENMRDLQKKVLEENAHLGLAFDGDGDRLGMVDETGRICDTNILLLLFAQDLLTRHPGAPVVYTVSNSGLLPLMLEQWGAKQVLCKVGQNTMLAAMRETNSLVGGELSGHYVLAEDYFYFDDALIAALKMCQIASHSGKTMSQLVDAFPKMHVIPERRPFVPDSEKDRIVQSVIKNLSALPYPVNTLDGIRIDFGDGAWAGIRTSSTSPCICVCVEAKTEERLQEVNAIVMEELKKYPELDWGRSQH